ncbi:hypothetical protein [Nonomuraea rubra]|uniref:Uncharacterized protein n=1 Tax=Nonomuraea rubra TaxID=46180 RepID=A0A7X0P2S1_9ACTN|nr:hypothetical protein [Nonomuraea rubra]MBB6554122.1 hypothetical protein [Nonomuraea rubra]
MAHEPGSSRFCQRCGSHVGTLAQCPRCRAHQGFPEQPTASYATGPEPDRLRRRPPAWRRAPVLISLAVAILAFVVTWWVVTANPSRPIQNTGAGQGVAPSSPRTAPGTGPETAAETDPGTSGGAASATPTSTSTPAPTGRSSGRAARQQAEAIEELLASSSDARSSLPDALASATRCDRDAVEDIRDITVSRRDQLATAQALGVSALKGGARLKDALVDALDASHDADAAFLAWAGRHVEEGCEAPVESDRDYRRGLDRSEAAQQAKTRFAAAWRPIAETYGLTVWKPDQI